MEPNKKNFKDYAMNIVDRIGVSSREHGIVEYITKNLQNQKNIKINQDPMGNLICKINSTKTNNKPFSLLIDTHMDELGLMISDITDDGFLLFVPIGGWWEHTMLSQKFTVITNKDKHITGTIGGIPIHILPMEKRKIVINMEDLYLDIGARSKKEIQDLGIEIGNIAYKNNKSFLLANNDYLAGKAIDNRISCSVLFYLLKTLSSSKMNCNLIGVFAAQEEVGLRGAKSGAYNSNADVAIVIDTTISHDQKDMTEHNKCSLGNGFAVEVLDATVISNPKLVNFIKKLADKYKINYSYSCITGGGTDGGYVYRARKGIITMVLSIPTRYLHTHNEVCSISDAYDCYNIVKHFIQEFTHKDFLSILNDKK